MDFEWDEAKNEANIAKHGVGFGLASRIFDGPVVTWTDDRRDYGEMRERSIGAVGDILFLTVIHTDRDGKRRIISARRASRSERTQYEEAVR